MSDDKRRNSLLDQFSNTLPSVLDAGNSPQLRETTREGQENRSFSIRPEPPANQPSSIWEAHEKRQDEQPAVDGNQPDDFLSPQHHRVQKELEEIKDSKPSDHIAPEMNNILKGMRISPEAIQKAMDAVKNMDGKCSTGQDVDCISNNHAPASPDQKQGGREPQ